MYPNKKEKTDFLLQIEWHCHQLHPNNVMNIVKRHWSTTCKWCKSKTKSTATAPTKRSNIATSMQFRILWSNQLKAIKHVIGQNFSFFDYLWKNMFAFEEKRKKWLHHGLIKCFVRSWMRWFYFCTTNCTWFVRFVQTLIGIETRARSHKKDVKKI